jgi:hypothetical protein
MIPLDGGSKRRWPQPDERITREIDKRVVDMRSARSYIVK